MTSRTERKKRAEGKRNYFQNILTLFLAELPFEAFLKFANHPEESMRAIEQQSPLWFQQEIRGQEGQFRSAYRELMELIQKDMASLEDSHALLKGAAKRVPTPSKKVEGSCAKDSLL